MSSVPDYGEWTRSLPTTSMELPVHSPRLQPSPSKFWNPTFRQNPEMCGMHKKSSPLSTYRGSAGWFSISLKEVPSKSPIKYCSCAQFTDTTITHLFLSESPSTGNWNKSGTPKTFHCHRQGQNHWSKSSSSNQERYKTLFSSPGPWLQPSPIFGRLVPEDGRVPEFRTPKVQNRVTFIIMKMSFRHD